SATRRDAMLCVSFPRVSFAPRLGGAGRRAKREPLSAAAGGATREGLKRKARNEPQAREDLQRKARPPDHREGGRAPIK
ncbi:MAG: hypothetical protein LBJ60_08045, partial [Tannerellaceae bacterium]|nr:hypothetical protein [Tannerellaceae bacterium]